MLANVGLTEEAARVFPWNRTIRTMPGYIAAGLAPSEENVQVIATALRGDPFAADLTYLLGFHYFLLGDHVKANHTFEVYAKLAPNNALGKQVKSALQSLKEH